MDKRQERLAAVARPHTPPVDGRRPWRRRYRIIIGAMLIALVMLGGSLAFAAKAGSGQSGFDTASVLPQPVTMPPSSGQGQAVFTAQSLKGYDGRDGRPCYAAVQGKVYEIPQGGQWQGGKHAPSNGQAYCGADLTAAIGRSPHGTSKLAELPQVGTFK